LRAEGVACDDSLADRLVGVAEHYAAPVEMLIAWIHESRERTPEEWASQCANYRGLRWR
jgi:hypothetical protein